MCFIVSVGRSKNLEVNCAIRKTDIITDHAASNGMVITQSCGNLLLMRDLRDKERNRPTFDLVGKAYCPECLPRAITEWVEEAR